MLVRLTSLTDAELNECAETMRQASTWFRLTGRYIHASVAKAMSQEANQTLLARAADHRAELSRQLSLVSPGAYDRD